MNLKPSLNSFKCTAISISTWHTKSISRNQVHVGCSWHMPGLKSRDILALNVSRRNLLQMLINPHHSQDFSMIHYYSWTIFILQSRMCGIHIMYNSSRGKRHVFQIRHRGRSNCCWRKGDAIQGNCKRLQPPTKTMWA